ncbi:choice-of-anchor D domain-containing protein [Haloferula sp. BvORR071]|uniref:choice-of-anchor D domain-containing protein n=1 Tax=Haloferula sp. BvORR071 TaxID=1396141 RepID=UPI0005506E48|nr:choice-of-anchor D domain-containing protein [Haloferula sp. BvORR071]
MLRLSLSSALATIIAICLALLARPAAAAPGDLDATFNPALNSSVQSVLPLPGGQILIGGSFTTVSNAPLRYLARLNGDGSADPGYLASTDAAVSLIALMPDGQAVIAGSFTTVNGTPRSRVARLNADGSLDQSFNPGCSNAPYFLLGLPDGKLLVAGNFTSIAGQSRSNLVRLNRDGSVDESFNPGVNGSVAALALQPDGKLLAGGSFTSAGGQIRQRIARLLENGNADPSFIGAVSYYSVSALVLQPDGRILVGGDFSTFSSYPCKNLGRLLADGSTDPAFQASFSSTVVSLILQEDGRILARFSGSSDVNGEARSGVARLEPNGDLDPNLHPAFSSSVSGMALQKDGRLLVCGSYLSVNGVTRSYLTRLEGGPITQSLEQQAGALHWLRSGAAPGLERVLVDVFTAEGGWVPAGEASRIPGGWSASPPLPPRGTVRFRGLATPTGSRSWTVDDTLTLGDAVPAIQVEDAGGNPLAGSLDVGSAMAGNSQIKTVKVRNTGDGTLSGLTVTVTGPDAADFKVEGGSGQSLAPGELTAFRVRFTPGATGSRLASLQVGSTGISPAVISLGGQGAGSTLVPAPVFGIAKGPLVVSEGFIATGLSFGTLVLDAAPAPGEVFTVVNNTSAAAINGTFTDLPAEAVVSASFGGETYSFTAGYRGGDGNDLVLTRTGTGSPLAAMKASTSFVELVVPATDGKLYATSSFFIENQIRYGIGRFNRDGSLDTGFNYSSSFSSSDPVRAMAVQDDGKVLVSSSSISSGASILTRLLPDGTPDSGFNAKVASIGSLDPGPASTIVVQPDGKILVGGYFTGIRRYLVRLNADGSLDSSFQPNSGGPVYSIALQPDGRILVGGGFTTMGGQTRNRVARLEANGNLDPGFDPNADSEVSVIGLSPTGEILLAGSFQTLAGVACNRFARLSAAGALDATFNPSPNGSLRCFAWQSDGKLVVGGNFTELDGLPRTRLARLLADGSVDGTFNASAEANVETLALTEDGSLFIGGYFTAVGGVQRNGWARLQNDAGASAPAIVGPDTARWTVSGSAAELTAAQIEIMPQGQSTWSAPVSATRISGDWEAGGLSLPTQGVGRWRGKTATARDGATACTVETIFTFGGALPEIAVKGPLGEGLQNGSTNLDFGNALTGTRSSLTLRISNVGDGILEGVLASIQGPDAASFGITKQPVAANLPGSSTELVIRFQPTAAGTKSATLLIASNDPDEAPFTITLSGTASTTVFSPVFNYLGQENLAFTGFDASSLSFGALTLNAAPAAGTMWRALDFSGTAAFPGRFTNLPDGAIVSASHQGVEYLFRASYTGGTGNDLVFILTGKGDFDPTFAGDADAEVYAMALQPDGKILIGGGPFARNGVGPDYLARLLPNGQVDESFRTVADSYVYSVSLLPDGKILAGGLFTKLGSTSSWNFLARFLADGSTDTSFSFTLFSGTPLCITPPLADGKFYIGTGGVISNGVYQTAVRRVNASGSVDSGFNAMVTPSVRSVVVQADGKVLIGGGFTAVNGVPWKRIARLNSDGSLDPTFNSGADGTVNALAIQPDGKIVVGGNFTAIGGGEPQQPSALAP